MQNSVLYCVTTKIARVYFVTADGEEARDDRRDER